METFKARIMVKWNMSSNNSSQTSLVGVLKTIFVLILVALGITSTKPYITGMGIPQTSVEVVPYTPPGFMYHTGTSVSCAIDVFTKTNKTTQMVYFKVQDHVGNYVIGDATTWVAGTRDPNDWQQWNSSKFTDSDVWYNCSVRVTENEFPGQTENYFNYTLVPVGYAIPGCENQADCTVNSYEYPMANNVFVHRNLFINTYLILGGNTTIIVKDTLNITGSGAIYFAGSAGCPGYSGALFNISASDIINSGTISSQGGPGSSVSCSGGSGGIILFQERTFNNIGIISVLGGTGGSSSCWCSGNPYCITHCYNGGAGGNGGQIIFMTTHPTSWINTGQILVTGGNGYNGCSMCAYDACASRGGAGGNAGTIQINAVNLSSSNTITAIGGRGGDGGRCTCWQSGNGGNGGNGGTNTWNVSENISISASVLATGGSGGASGNWGSCTSGSAGAAGTNGMWNVSYCGNGTGMDWSKFNPAATNQTITCQYLPTTSFVAPNSTTNLTALYDNITVIFANMPENNTVILQYSRDNGTTWSYILPNETTFIPVDNSTTYNISNHRFYNTTAPQVLMRAMLYNASNGIFGDWFYSSSFNNTLITTTLANTTVPSPISGSIFTIYCNYSEANTSDYITDATPYLVLDGTSYNLSWDDVTRQYYYTNTGILSAGNHSFYCNVSKTDYLSQVSQNVTFIIGGFDVIIAGGQTQVWITCPFPTIAGMQPRYQRAGVGIFRVQNQNITALKNYTLSLSTGAISGTNTYAKIGSYTLGYADWILLTNSPQRIITDLNSTNSTAYVWLKTDCINALPGTYNTPRFIFMEET